MHAVTILHDPKNSFRAALVLREKEAIRTILNVNRLDNINRLYKSYSNSFQKKAMEEIAKEEGLVEMNGRFQQQIKNEPETAFVEVIE